ncbi:type II secretion system protein [Haloferula sp.]|uniref:type II secretion system protein n=1 Tax=Haloferula sp. TaxID=2497595 RepID=UPI0032A0FB29
MKKRLKARRQQGFTLVELMVVITIIVVLAGISVAIYGKARKAADRVDAVNRIRQSGNFILGTAADNNRRISIFVHGSGNYERALRDLLEEDGMSRDETYKMIITPAYYRVGVKGAKMDRWHAWGTNVDDRPGLGVVWTETDANNGNGSTKAGVLTLPLARCKAPSDYPLLADSCDATGVPRLRFSNERFDQRFAMRYGGKGPMFFLDGSARMVGPDEMGGLGVTDGYLFGDDDPVYNPDKVTAEDTSRQ